VAIPTADGTFMAHFTPRGLAGLEFPGQASPHPAAAWHTPPPDPHGWVSITRTALARALAGQSPDRLPPLDWSRTTSFRRRVWQALLQIPAGQTRTYAAVAAEAGRPRAARAAGGACGANPIPVLVPCHRVVAAGGGLGGFSAGPAWKAVLLQREKACP
jgi:O-6-methylguanine DNA methyltransferase